MSICSPLREPAKASTDMSVCTSIGSTHQAVQAAVLLADAGINANPIAHPAVAEHEARLRFFLSSEHTPDMIDHTLKLLTEIVAGLGPRFSKI